jgi:hypothetical protein
MSEPDKIELTLSEQMRNWDRHNRESLLAQQFHTAGDVRLFNGVRFTLLYEQFPGLWMTCETDNPRATPRLLCATDLKDTGE